MTKNTIKVRGQDVAMDAMLAALYNHTQTAGMGVLHDLGRDMTRNEAAQILEKRGWHFNFDWVQGRPLKVYILDGTLRGEDLYERDGGSLTLALEDALTMPEIA